MEDKDILMTERGLLDMEDILMIQQSPLDGKGYNYDLAESGK